MATRVESKCPKCGKRKSKNAMICRVCELRLSDARRTRAQAIVATGKCPLCGRTVKRNWSLSGWWQCEQFGSMQFRTDPTQPSCEFQIFTE